MGERREKMVARRWKREDGREKIEERRWKREARDEMKSCKFCCTLFFVSFVLLC